MKKVLGATWHWEVTHTERINSETNDNMRLNEYKWKKKIKRIIQEIEDFVRRRYKIDLMTMESVEYRIPGDENNEVSQGSESNDTEE